MRVTTGSHYQFLIGHPTMFLVALFSLLVAISAPSSASPPSMATVLACSGGAVTTSGGTSVQRTSVENAELRAGDSVETSVTGKALLLFTDGSRVYMNRSTSLSISDQREKAKGHIVLFHLKSGEVFVQARPDTTVWTEAALIAVRGTDFGVRVNALHSTELTVVRGAVDFYNEHGSVVVNAGQKSDAVLGSAPTSPVSIQAGDMVYQWTFDVTRARIDREEQYVSYDPAVLASQLRARADVYAQSPNPTSAISYGDVLSDLGRYNEAASAYQAGLSGSSTNASASTKLAYAYLKLDRIDDAEAVLGTASTAQANIAKAWIALRRNRNEDAVRLGSACVGVAGVSDEAKLVCGIANARSRSNVGEGKLVLADAATCTDERVASQARAWLALAMLADGDIRSAVAEARTAVAAEPHSALAHGALAIACMSASDISEAEREARLAVKIDPRDIGSEVVGAHALIASGHPDAAARLAARANAQDPFLPEPLYVLALADQARGDLPHADREVTACIALSPSFVPALSLDAALKVKEGKSDEALALILPAAERLPQSPELEEALARIYYAKSDYIKSMAAYHAAIRLQPRDALAYSELSRVCLDANLYSDAMRAARRAVDLSPSIAQFHAILGLTYEYAYRAIGSHLDPTAEQEYREALSIDPRNGLARARIALSALNNSQDQNGLAGASAAQLASIAQGSIIFAEPQRQQNAAAVLSNLTQAILYDPSVTEKLYPGGSSTELSEVSDDQSNNVLGSHRDTLGNGTEHDLVQYSSTYTRTNAISATNPPSTTVPPTPQPPSTVVTGDALGKTASAIGFGNMQPWKGFSVLGSFVHERMNQTFPLQATDSLSSQTTQDSTGDMGALVVSQRLCDAATISAAINGLFTQDVFNNPFVIEPFLKSSTRSISTETRVDTTLGNNVAHAVRLSIGGSEASQSVSAQSLVYVDPDPMAPPQADVAQTELHVSNVYGQITQNVSSAWSYTAMVRRERDMSQVFALKQDKVVPSGSLRYQCSKDLFARVTGARDLNYTTLASLMPADSQLAIEPEAIPIGLADQTDVLQVDVDKSFSKTSLKAFGFRTFSTRLTFSEAQANAAYRTPVLADDVLHEGAGVRLERELSSTLFANAYVCKSHTTASYDPAALLYFNNGPELQAGPVPFNAVNTASLGLRYTNNAGTNVSVNALYQDKIPIMAQTAGVLGLSTVTQAIFPARTYLNVQAGKEISRNAKLFVSVNNALNVGALQFNSLIQNCRTVQFGAACGF